MALQQRRVITGHDGNGKAIVLIDEQVQNVAARRPGAEASVIWTTEGFPISNDDSDDTSNREVATTLPGGVVFRVLKLDPGCAPRNHRTDSTDFAVVIAGEIDMELDDSVVHLKAGDVLVQRGTIHNWVNNGTEPCVIAFTLVDARPVTVGGQTLHAAG